MAYDDGRALTLSGPLRGATVILPPLNDPTGPRPPRPRPRHPLPCPLPLSVVRLLFIMSSSDTSKEAIQRGIAQIQDSRPVKKKFEVRKHPRR